MEILQVWVVKLLVFIVLGCWSCSSLAVNVSDVSEFSKLRSWKQSTLYKIESDAGYETNPLLIQLVGSRYGESLPMLEATSDVEFHLQTWAMLTVTCSATKSRMPIFHYWSLYWEGAL